MAAPEILVYSKPNCPSCKRAKHVLQQKGFSYEEVDLSEHPDQIEGMIERSHGRRTVPQIFINGHHVGGYDDLEELNNDGELDAMLGLE